MTNTDTCLMWVGLAVENDKRKNQMKRETSQVTVGRRLDFDLTKQIQILPQPRHFSSS